MPVGDIGSAIETYTFDATHGLYPALTHVDRSLFLVCYAGPSDYGIAKSFGINTSGHISEPPDNSLTFISVITNDHYSVLRQPNVVSDVYQIQDSSANLEAIIVNPDGTLSQHENHRSNLVPNFIATIQPVLRPDSIFACVHAHSNGYIYIATGLVAEDGEVGLTPIEVYQKTDFLSDTCSMCKHVDDIHVVVFSDVAQHKWAQSINITSAGGVSTTGQPRVDICSEVTSYCNVIKIKDNWFVVVTYGGGSIGRAIVFRCDPDGTVSIPTNNVYTLETSSCYWPRAIRLSDDVFAVVYTSESFYGKIKTVQVGTGAAATWTELDSHIFTGEEMLRVKIQLRDKHIAVLASHDSGNLGHLNTIELESGKVALGYHEFTMNIGP